jgi:hypothetical protein
VRIAAAKGVRFAPAQAFKSELNSSSGKKAAGKKAAPAKRGAKSSGTTRKAPAKKAGKATKKR